MTMPNEMPYRGAKEACQAAQYRCIRERGNFCEAYDGVSCKTCLKYEEGIKRRKKRFAEEEKQMVCSIVSGNTRMRLRILNPTYFCLEIGELVDLPPLFIANKGITISKEEMPIMKELIAMVRT